MYTSPTSVPAMEGVASFEASINASYTGPNGCASNSSCSYSCELQVDGLSGFYYMRFCPEWVPPSSGQAGWWCWAAGMQVLRWGSDGYSNNTVNISQGSSTNFQNHVSATMTFSRPMRVSNEFAVSVTGGHRFGPYGIHVFHAGESAAISSQPIYPGGTFALAPCVDTDPINGVCDEYEAACRRFGDLDWSGSVDAADLAALLRRWGLPGPFGDLDSSGIVDGGDLATLLSRWGQSA